MSDENKPPSDSAGNIADENSHICAGKLSKSPIIADEKPREWWMHANGNERGELFYIVNGPNPVVERDGTMETPVHVIEHSAYAALEAKCAELDNQLKSMACQLIDRDFDLIKDRDRLAARLSELIKRLEPSEETYESALGEVDYLHECEQLMGARAQRESDLRTELAETRKLLDATTGDAMCARQERDEARAEVARLNDKYDLQLLVKREAWQATEIERLRGELEKRPLVTERLALIAERVQLLVKREAWQANEIERLRDECERLKLTYGQAFKERDELQERVRSVYCATHTEHEVRTEGLALKLAKAKAALELVEPWLPRLSGMIGQMSDANLRKFVRETLKEIE